MMHPLAKFAWDSLEFRTPAMLRLIEPLEEDELRWRPPNHGNSVAWQLWHIAEVEDNWVRDVVMEQSKHYPFNLSVRTATPSQYPNKAALLEYFLETRRLTHQRLAETTADNFERIVRDEHFGELTVAQVWGGVVTSFAWHAGQIALTSRLLGRAARAF